jgi:hypothetical protein
LTRNLSFALQEPALEVINTYFQILFCYIISFQGIYPGENQKGGMMFSRIKTPYYTVPVSILIALFAFAAFADLPAGYTGLPFRNMIQSIPGVIYTWRYDSAGVKNITWSYPYASNRGDYHGRTTAGVEDPVGVKRLNTGWDHMAPGAGSDTMIHYSDSNGIYLGYIETGEWVKMTINVAQAGTYQFDAMVTACCAPNSTTECINPPCDPSIRIDFLNGTDSVSTGKITLTRTGYYHTYMYENNLARVTLKQGIQLHKITILGTPPANLWYFKYTLVSTPAMERQRHYGAFGALKTERVSLLGNGDVLVRFQSNNSAPVTISCFDAQGKFLFSRHMATVNRGLNQCTLAGHATAGTRLIKLLQGNQSTVSKVIVTGK